MPLITPDGVLSYPNLFNPKLPPNPKPGQKPRYSTVLLFPVEMDEQQRALLLAMKNAALKALKDKWGERTEAMLTAGGLTWPFSKKWTNKMGEVKYDKDKWQCFINPWSEQAPGIVSQYRGADGKPMKLTDQSEIYAGAKARLSVNPFIYDISGNAGVAFGLQNVQKRGEGPRMDNRISAQDTFDAEDRPEAAMDISDVGSSGTPAADADGPIVPGEGSKLADLFT